MVERLDAMRAARIAELDRSDGLRTALRCTLVKSADHLAVFDEVFDLYFGPASRPPGSARPTPPTQPPLDLEQAVRASCATARKNSPVRSPSRQSSEYVQFEPGRPVAGVMYERVDAGWPAAGGAGGAAA